MKVKTEDEIVAEIRRLVDNRTEDFFGTKVGDLIARLPFEKAHAAGLLKDDISDEDRAKWEENREALTEEAIVACIKDYLEFAWQKANGCRGLSAQRSIHHFEAWYWLLGEEEFAAQLDADYRYYGKPQLVRISERPEIAFPWKDHDDDSWTNDELTTGITAEEALARC